MFDLKMLPVSAGVVAAAVVVAASPAQAANIASNFNPFTVNGEEFNIGILTGTFADNQALLESQVFFGDEELAKDFAEAVDDFFGFPNIPNVFPAQNEGPFFAFAADSTAVSVANLDAGSTGFFVEVDDDSPLLAQPSVFAVAESTAVPTPALLPAMLGMGASVIRKRKKQASAE